MTTLVSYASSQKAAQETAQGQGRAKLVAAQAALSAAEAQQAAELAAQKATEADISGLRARLERTTVPSEINALVEQISTLTIALRRTQGRLRAAQEAVALAKADLEFASARLARAQRRLAEVNKVLEGAQEGEERRQSWKALVALPPLSTLRTDAGNVLSGTGTTLLADATAKFSTVPVRLMELAVARHVGLRASLEAARDASETAEDGLAARADADAGLAGAVQKARIEFLRAERAFGEHVSNAKSRYDWAVGVLKSLQGLPVGENVLSAREATDANDAALRPAREAAANEAKTVAEREKVVAEKRTALRDAELAAQAGDPNATDVSAVPAVTAAQGALDTAVASLKAATDGFSSGERNTLQAWQLILPDSAWQKLLDFLEAKAILTDLSTADPAALQGALDTSESTYADALGDAAESTASLEYFEDALARRAALAAAAQAGAQVRALSGIRGDAL
jgi:hypothetical protein